MLCIKMDENLSMSSFHFQILNILLYKSRILKNIIGIIWKMYFNKLIKYSTSRCQIQSATMIIGTSGNLLSWRIGSELMGTH
jgi:hypothetical protein